MRKLHRTVSAALALLALLLGGCTPAGESGAENGQTAPALKIGIDANYEPYTYLDDDGSYVGLDIEISTEACRRMGFQPEYEAIKWDDKDEYLENGEIDCIWSCYSMTGREDRYLWAGPYLYSRQVVAVPMTSAIQSLGDLNGRRAAVMSSTKPEELLLSPKDNLPRVSELYCVDTLELAFAALRKGYADAVAAHEDAISRYLALWPGQYRVLDQPLQSVQVGVAFRLGGDETMAETLSQTLAEMREDGTIAALAEKYGLKNAADGGAGV